MSTPPQGPGPQDHDGSSPAAPGQFPEIAPGVPRYGQYAPEGYVPPNQQVQPNQAEPVPDPHSPPPWQSAAATPAGVPALVQRGFVMIIAAAIVHLAISVIGLFQIPQMRSVVLESMARFPELNASMADTVITLSFVFNAIGLALYLLVAFNLRAGKRWARMLGTVLAVLSLTMLVGSPFAIVQVGLGVLGIVYCWLAPSREYFKR